MTYCAVIRACGERTASKCEELVREQFDCVHVVENVRPLAEAVRHSFEIAVASGKPWLVVFDADMLVVPDLKAGLDYHIDNDELWQVTGMVDDKLYGIRKGGPRLTRTSVIPELVVDDNAVRPESALFHSRPGAVSVREVWARHDYEQYYRDLHRKGAAHRRKHKSWGQSIVPNWRKSADLDLRAAAAGWDSVPIAWPEKGAL